MLLIYLIIFFSFAINRIDCCTKIHKCLGMGRPPPPNIHLGLPGLFFMIYLPKHMLMYMYTTLKKTQLTRARNKLCIKNVYHWYRKKPCIGIYMYLILHNFFQVIVLYLHSVHISPYVCLEICDVRFNSC